jgi:predicted O-methyltransferase YrrM
MSIAQWSAVDDYFAGAITRPDAALEAALESSRAAGLPAIHVSANQGKFLHIWAKSMRAARILEVGTLGGYSTIWLGRALPAGGRLISLEAEAKHVEVARANIARAGLSAVVEVRHGRALETLPRLAEEKLPAFDLVFIDADKPGNADYFAWALKLTRPGSVIIVDNVVRKGAVTDPHSTDVNVLGVRRLMDLIEKEPRVSATAIQTVGNKGYDGFVAALVLGD